MPSKERLIGTRLEEILKEKKPEMEFIGGSGDKIPDFKHEWFYAEAKAACFQPGFGAHIKPHQIDSFPEYEKEGPVIYLFGLHGYTNSKSRLAGKDVRTQRMMLTKGMHLERLYIVDNSVVEAIWKRRDHVSKSGMIRDCTVKDTHLRQIIQDSPIIAANTKYPSAREYYKIPDSFLFSMPEYNSKMGFEIAHIMPKGTDKILRYFYE